MWLIWPELLALEAAYFGFVKCPWKPENFGPFTQILGRWSPFLLVNFLPWLRIPGGTYFHISRWARQGRVHWKSFFQGGTKKFKSKNRDAMSIGHLGCVYMYIYIYTNFNTHIYICMCIISLSLSLYIYIYVCVCVCTHTQDYQWLRFSRFQMFPKIDKL